MEPGRKEAIGRTYSLLGMLCLLPDALVIRLTQVQVQSENASAYATNMLLGFGLLFWRSLGQLVSISVLHFTLFSHCSATTCVHTVRSTLPMPSLFPGGMFQMLAQAFFITSIANTTVANTLLCIAMSPALSAVFSRLVFREPLPIRTWIAVVIAFLFMMLSVIGDLANNPDSTGTAALPVALPVFQGAFFSTSRYFGSIVQPPVDMVPSLAVAGFYNAISAILVPFGYTFLTVGTRYVQAPEAILLLLAQSFLTPLLVWAVLGNEPSMFSLIGGIGVIITNMVVNIMALVESKRDARPITAKESDTLIEKDANDQGVEGGETSI